MGVEFKIWCRECKERVTLHKLSEREEVVQSIINGTLEPNLEDLPEWVKLLVESHRMWQIEESINFKKRHPKCDLFLYNDHMDIDDQEGTYYPEVDYDKPLPRTKDFEKNIIEKTRKYIEYDDRDTHTGPFITNRYSLPYGYEKREDLVIKIPVKGPIKKLVHKYYGQGMDSEMGMQKHIEYIYVIDEQKLFFTYSSCGLSGRIISKKDLEEEIGSLKCSTRIYFEVVEL